MCTRNYQITTTGSVPVRLDYATVACTRNCLITATGSVPVKVPQILLSSLEQINTNTKWHANFVFAKSSQKHLFRLLIKFYIQTKHHPIAVSKWGGKERNQNQCLFTNTLASIYTTSCTCENILIFANILQLFIADTFYCKFQW